MNKLARTLLGGVSIYALASVPAVAEIPSAFHVTALHGGRVVNKTKLHNRGATHITYTYGVYTYVSSAQLNKTVKLYGTFYKFEEHICSTPVKAKAPKKSEYAKIGIATETYSLGCPSGPTVFYGNTYELKDPNAKGHTDHFVSTQVYQFRSGGTKYRETVNLDVDVSIN